MGRVMNVSVVVATAVSNEGRREILGFDTVTVEDTAGVDGVSAFVGGQGPVGGGAGHL